MKINLDQLESRLQALIEVHLVKYLPGRKVEGLIAQQLAMALKSNLITQSDSTKLAPNLYTLTAHSDTIQKWHANSHLLEQLTQILETIAEDAGIKFVSKPTVSTAIDNNLSGDDIHITASYIVEPIAETQGIPIAEEDEEGVSSFLPENAFLIVHGTKVFPLNQSVINIGRRMDNHLVIDDPHISRNHAQLRTMKGYFVIFDLNSFGGTFVNGERINKRILSPGDVISLAGVPLIFGQDNPPQRPDLAETSPRPFVKSERSTLVNSKSIDEQD